MSLDILIVDDETGITDLLQSLVERDGHSATVVNDAREVEALLSEDFDLIFLDLNMPYMDGIQVMRLLADTDVSASLVLMSGFDHSVLSTAYELALAHHLNILSHVSKPFDIKDIQAIFKQAEEKEDVQEVQSRLNVEIEEADLRLAMQENRIEMYYQPQLDVKLNRVVGIESLCRLREKTGDLIYPEAFIAKAEKCGVIHELTILIAHKVAKDMKDVLANHHDVTVSLNISVHDLEHLDFPEVLEKIFLDQDIDLRRVVVEVTESLLMHELEIGLDILARMRLKGFKVSIDDFGKGAATLEHIKHFPVTEIKIDREFIEGIVQTEKSRILVQHTLKMAHQLELDVVAEGVDLEEILNWLVKNGCDIIQGYWFSAPLTLGALSDLLDGAAEKIEADSIFCISDPITQEDNDKDEQFLNAPREAVAVVESPAATGSSNQTQADQVTEDPMTAVQASASPAPVTPAQGDKSNDILVSTILPFTGTFGFIGTSQLYGIKAALDEYNSAPNALGRKVQLEFFNDMSDLKEYENILQNRVSDQSLACIGGVFTLKETRRFIQAVLKSPKVVIGAFSGSILLRKPEWQNLFNVRPGYEDELVCIINQIKLGYGKVLVVSPDNMIGQRARAIIDKLIAVRHLRFSVVNKTQSQFIQAINDSGAKHIIFIGCSKTLTAILNMVAINAVSWYATSLVGVGSLIKSLKHCPKRVTVTVPMDDYKTPSLAATQFRKSMVPLLHDEQNKYINAISFEAYINTKVLLLGLERSKSLDLSSLKSCLEGLHGVDIGLPSPVSWDAEKRQFLHKVKMLEIMEGSIVELN